MADFDTILLHMASLLNFCQTLSENYTSWVQYRSGALPLKNMIENEYRILKNSENILENIYTSVRDY